MKIAVSGNYQDFLEWLHKSAFFRNTHTCSGVSIITNMSFVFFEPPDFPASGLSTFQLDPLGQVSPSPGKAALVQHKSHLAKGGRFLASASQVHGPAELQVWHVPSPSLPLLREGGHFSSQFCM